MREWLCTVSGSDSQAVLMLPSLSRLPPAPLPHAASHSKENTSRLITPYQPQSAYDPMHSLNPYTRNLSPFISFSFSSPFPFPPAYTSPPTPHHFRPKPHNHTVSHTHRERSFLAAGVGEPLLPPSRRPRIPRRRHYLISSEAHSV